jgi:hypothetical protein
MCNIPSSIYDRKLGAHLDCVRTLLDQLAATALEEGAHDGIAVAKAARELICYIEQRRPALRSSIGRTSITITIEIESARKKLNAWIVHLHETLHGIASLAS